MPERRGSVKCLFPTRKQKGRLCFPGGAADPTFWEKRPPNHNKEEVWRAQKRKRDIS